MTPIEPGTSPAEVTSITAVGLWLLIVDREYFIPFSDYPAVRQATVEQIVRVEQPAPAQRYWPDLDIDIELPALDEPQRFPLVFQ
jgi:hypothetical protein